jgi:hypothetical protein
MLRPFAFAACNVTDAVYLDMLYEFMPILKNGPNDKLFQQNVLPQDFHIAVQDYVYQRCPRQQICRGGPVIGHLIPLT